MRLGLDAMGGDFAPEVAVKGAIMALAELDKGCRIVLYGDEARIRAVLEAEQCNSEQIEIVATTEVIEMYDHPVRAFQQKSDSSITVGFHHLAEGLIDGFASAGSTGAIMVGSTQVVRSIEGIIRPTIATVVPTITGAPVVLLDVGLNVDCKPDVLEQYALIGSVFAKSVLEIENPRVALLNIGEEATKGDLNTRATYEHLQVGAETGRYNFVGNIEASHIFTSRVADVVVCDGFVGNIVLKLAEGLYEINKSMGVTNTFWEGLNYEMAGGIPVLGVNAPVTIGHGKSTPLAIKSMLLATEHTIRLKLVERLREAFR
ncbi:MAG: phosphate acyltransferase PlsX [Rikenellaceae bacterium]|nr:phosphate acyltransferase PlsX [Rikenellaceae bacterium]